MAHRDLVQTWNNLVPYAVQAGWYLGRRTPVGCTIRIYPDWRISRAEAERRIAWISQFRGQVLPAFSQVAVAQTFGVEFEMILPIGTSHAQLAARIQAAGVACTAEHYNHALRSHWKVVTDGSLGDYIRGAEVVSPILSGDEGFEAVRKVCKVLVDAGCKINRKCGFHVHVGARGRNVNFMQNVVALYRHHERTIDAFLAPSRRGSANQYCRTLIGAHQSWMASSRYFKVNTTAFDRHGTVEFRQHQGTIEAAKAISWIKLCLKITQVADQNFIAPTSNLFQDIEADAELSSFFTRRAEQLARRRAA